MDHHGWDLLVAKQELASTRFEKVETPDIEPGQVLLRVSRVGLTANNVTYASEGDSMSYWRFFPAAGGWGRVPLWGFADVQASATEGVQEGARLFGYLPTSSHLVVRPERIDQTGFRDGSVNRMDLPRAYNVYHSSTTDPAYDPATEDLQVLYRPLFWTSFVLDDHLADKGFFGAERMIVSSSSSKTAYATAFCLQLRKERPLLVGLTSRKNVAFTSSLGVYDEIIEYEDVADLPSGHPSLYLDLSGSPKLRKTIHERLGEDLLYDCVVGSTHPEGSLQGPPGLPGPEPVFFFAPDQIRKRRQDWGREGLASNFGAAWKGFVSKVGDWVDVARGHGPEDLREAWLEVLGGRTDPRRGHVIDLH